MARIVKCATGAASPRKSATNAERALDEIYSNIPVLERAAEGLLGAFFGDGSR